jgi:hypothetical protein
MRENPYPDITASFYVTGHGYPGCFQLTGSNPAALCRLKAELAEEKSST